MIGKRDTLKKKKAEKGLENFYGILHKRMVLIYKFLTSKTRSSGSIFSLLQKYQKLFFKSFLTDQGHESHAVKDLFLVMLLRPLYDPH